MDADAVEFEDRTPDAGQEVFPGVARGNVACRVAVFLRRRQGFAVEFAVGGQRQAVQHDEGAGDHVVGQLLLQRLAQDAGLQLFLPCPDDVGDQAFVARFVFARDDDGFLYGCLAVQGGFDFAQLDAEAPHLDLVVDASQVVDVAVGQVARQVSCSVHPFAGFLGIRVGDEFLGGAPWAVVIAPCHTTAADRALAGYA